MTRQEQTELDVVKELISDVLDVAVSPVQAVRILRNVLLVDRLEPTCEREVSTMIARLQPFKRWEDVPSFADWAKQKKEGTT